MIVEDAFFYQSHRLLHSTWMYKSIHKIHHEIDITFSLAATHTHPVEYVIGNIIPMMVGPAILDYRMHRASMFGWFFIRIGEGIDGHCGYSFPWNPYRVLPGVVDDDYHFFHHFQNIGNYSSFFSLWDTVFGTNSEFYK